MGKLLRHPSPPRNPGNVDLTVTKVGDKAGAEAGDA